MDLKFCAICSAEGFHETSNHIIDSIFKDVVDSQLPQGSHLCRLCRHQLVKLQKFKHLCLMSLSINFPNSIFGDHIFKSKSYFSKTITNTVTACTTCLDYYEHTIGNDVQNGESNSIKIFPGHRCDDSNYKQDSLSSHSLDYKSDDELFNSHDETKNELHEDGYSHTDEHLKRKCNENSIETPINHNDQELSENDRPFEKIILSAEEQKSELESMRKNAKYINSMFKCYTCALGFGFKDSYQSHMVRHEESNGEYCCPVCSLRFAQSSVRSMHVALHRERHRCLRCGLVVKRDRRRQHLARCVGGEGAGCHRCGKMFPDTRCLQQHLRRMHRAGRQRSDTHRCTVCSTTYTNASNLRTHMIAHANTSYNCALCESVFRSPYALNRHTKLHTDNSQHYCSTCEAWFKTRKTFVAHLKTTSAHTTDVYECQVCGRLCPSRQSLSTHAESHAAPRHACAACGAVYASRKSLLRHARTHDADPQAGRLVCHLCGKTYKGKSKLRRHLREVCAVNSA